jgi:hypothetical protein
MAILSHVKDLLGFLGDHLAALVLSTYAAGLVLDHKALAGRTGLGGWQDETDITTAVTGAYRTHPLFWLGHIRRGLQYIFIEYTRLDAYLQLLGASIVKMSRNGYSANNSGIA